MLLFSFFCIVAKKEKQPFAKFFDRLLIFDCFCKNMKVKRSKVVSIEGRA